MKNRLLIFLGTIGLVTQLAIHTAFAHEAYVLPAKDFQAGLKIYSKNPFAPLVDPSHLPVFILLTVLVVGTYLLVLLFSMTRAAAWFDKQIKRATFYGPLAIRFAVAASFFFSAQLNVIMGPELPLQPVPYGWIVRILLYVTSIMVLVGFFTEFAAVIGLALFLYVSRTYGQYMFTYANYFGELIVLLLFGARFLSLDRLLFGPKPLIAKLERWKQFELPIVRVLYGIALVYAGYTIKFEHQILTIEVYNMYHLGRFFHASAQFISAGAGLSEIAIGLFIIFGFFQRLTVFISLVFITLSLLYFKEIVWPHFILFGVSFSLLINSADPISADRYIVPTLKKILHRK